MFGFIKAFRNLDKEVAKKIGFLSGIYALIIFTYSIIRPLKDAVFLGFVGAEYQPIAKIGIMCFSPVFVLFYSLIMSRMQRHHAVATLIGGYAIICLFLAGILLHPVIGLANTATSSGRILGWFVYALFDIFPLAIVTGFWALTSSVSMPAKSSTQYGIMTASSRLGGVLASGFGYSVLKSALPQTFSIPALIILSATTLGLGSYIVLKMFKVLKPETLTGYADVHEIQIKKKKTGILEGLKAVVTEPYAIGIFVIFCAYELISALTNFRVQYIVAAQTAHSVQKIGSYVFGYTFLFQLLGFFIALFGTTTLPKKIGMRVCLLITPAILFLFSTALIGNLDLMILTGMMIVMRALNYGFNTPVREMLYIPTSHKIQFMAKGWIDSFGKTFSKAAASVVNLASTTARFAGLSAMIAPISLVLSGGWIVTAILLGSKHHIAVKKGEVIGGESKEILFK
ncbi:hypothetical protein KAU11_02050 [Candidatus Babeliales bacterium]|nr:hypothetical protein [Candidatus Babeliales bacterium]